MVNCPYSFVFRKLKTSYNLFFIPFGHILMLKLSSNLFCLDNQKYVKISKMTNTYQQVDSNKEICFFKICLHIHVLSNLLKMIFSVIVVLEKVITFQKA